MPNINIKLNNCGISKASLLILVLCLITLSYLVWRNVSISKEQTLHDSQSDISEQTNRVPSKNSNEDYFIEEDDTGIPKFNPFAIDSTIPSNLIFSTGIQENGKDVKSYSAEHPIDFGLPENYTDVEGIVTFRGNNFRDSGSYGTANIVNRKFDDDHWNISTSSLESPDGNVWTGNGWVGQPLMMTWSKEIRQNMNMYDWAKEAESLTEVIYASLDGNVYFIDLTTGKKTRDDLNLGYTFKGAGALDPRGFPILYLGSGYDSTKGTSHAFVINLFDCSIMYEFGKADPYSLRGNLSFFDGSALVDADTDQLIYPGENGILYIIKLNTTYDPEKGTISISPTNIVKWRYKGTRTTADSYRLGMEDSPIIWRSHIIMSDNGGNLMCLNLNTLELDWVQNTLDDTNCTPVLELEGNHPYVYTSTSFHTGWRAPNGNTVPIPIWKIDAVTGEIIWKKEYSCLTVDGVSGGVQGTLAIGKNSLKDLIFVPVARTPHPYSGILVALNKNTGEVVWEIETQMYSWSSPVTVYTESGDGYLVFCTAGGYIYLIDGLHGYVYDSLNVNGSIEASPAIYDNTIVVGTRSQSIWGINIT